jgi:hypothetical protein
MSNSDSAQVVDDGMDFETAKTIVETVKKWIAPQSGRTSIGTEMVKSRLNRMNWEKPMVLQACEVVEAVVHEQIATLKSQVNGLEVTAQVERNMNDERTEAETNLLNEAEKLLTQAEAVVVHFRPKEEEVTESVTDEAPVAKQSLMEGLLSRPQLKFLWVKRPVAADPNDTLSIANLPEVQLPRPGDVYQVIPSILDMSHSSIEAVVEWFEAKLNSEQYNTSPESEMESVGMTYETLEKLLKYAHEMLSLQIKQSAGILTALGAQATRVTESYQKEKAVFTQQETALTELLEACGAVEQKMSEIS